MLAFESLTPEGLLKEVAEYLRQNAARAKAEAERFTAPTKTGQKILLAAAHARVNALEGIASDLEGAAILPANSKLRKQPAK